MSDLALILGAIFFLLLGNGFFSGSEIALISARKAALRKRAEEGSRGARLAEALRAEPERFMATVQIGVTVCGTLAGVCGGWIASRHVEPWLEHIPGLPLWAPAAVTASAMVALVIVYVEMVLGELVPKALALRFAAPIASAVAIPISVMARMSRVPLRLVTESTRLILRLFGLKGPMREGLVSAEEIEHLVAEGRLQGVLSQSDASLLEGVFKFRDMPVKSVMIPRTKAFALDVATEPSAAVKRIVEAGFSRVPIYEGTFDNPIGILYVKDVLASLERSEVVDLRARLHVVHVVPDSKNVGDLLRELQKKRSHLALVINEHGSVVGIATLEDLVEEIVGEIRDEYDEGEEKAIERLKGGGLVVEGTVSNSLLRESYAIPIPVEIDAETVGGFILERLGSVPKGGETVGVEGYRLTVVDVERNRVAKVKIEKM
ncbi:MAG: HlyC/CorC family transporter [Vicinamibacteria bacterium]|nr:HlyC/CorC family transporter [Vicinamibacteria bacterium]